MGSKSTAVRYEVLRECSDEKGVMQDIVVLDDVENKEGIDRLGRQLSKQFRDKLIVAVNVFEYAGSGARNSHAAATPEKAGMGHRLAQYIRSREIGLHQIVYHPRQGDLLPVVVKYS